VFSGSQKVTALVYSLLPKQATHSLTVIYGNAEMVMNMAFKVGHYGYIKLPGVKVLMANLKILVNV
jgi:hypothetical protein